MFKLFVAVVILVLVAPLLEAILINFITKLIIIKEFFNKR